MDFIQKGHTIHWRCCKCQWEIMTSFFELIELDQNKYSIYLKEDNLSSINNIKMIAKICNTNYNTAKSYIKKGNIEIFKGKATEVKRTLVELEKLKITYNVMPDFPYAILYNKNLGWIF